MQKRNEGGGAIDATRQDGEPMHVNPAMSSSIAKHLRCLALLACLMALPGLVPASTLRVSVHGPSGIAANAVVILDSPQAAAAVKPVPGVIDQRDTQFTPLLSVINVGSAVRFPNSDDLRHQVYSFSPAKLFQLPLYGGKEAQPVTFDAPGVVELGCNIHDWMIAYVVVAATPYHAITDASGVATIDSPAGHYTMHVWHPEMAAGAAPYEEQVDLDAQPRSRSVTLPLAARLAPPAKGDEKLRALQDRFRKITHGR